MSKSPPTKKKLDKSRRDGKVVKAQLLTAGIVAFVLLIAGMFIPLVFLRNKILLEYLVTEGAKAPGVCLAMTARYFFILISAWLLLGAGVAVLLEWLRVGLVFSWTSIALDLSRLNPGVGVGRILSGVKGLWLVALKLVFLGTLFIWLLRSELERIAAKVVTTGSAHGEVLLGSVLVRGICLGAGAFIILGALEYGVNRIKLMKELEMSAEELKQEFKEDEGDPLIKGQRRALHREISYRAMVQKIRSSKVVIVERA